jgi:hypothetical protein
VNLSRTRLPAVNRGRVNGARKVYFIRCHCLQRSTKHLRSLKSASSSSIYGTTILNYPQSNHERCLVLAVAVPPQRGLPALHLGLLPQLLNHEQLGQHNNSGRCRRLLQARLKRTQPLHSKVQDCLGRWPVQLRKSPLTTPPSSRSFADGGIFTLYSGVAVGSSIGHAIGGWFGGGSSAQPEAPAAQDQYQQPAQNAYSQPMDNGLYNAQGGYGSTTQQQQQQAGPCAENVKSFTRCMDENQGNMTVCGWYLDQLKACQAAARQY